MGWLLPLHLNLYMRTSLLQVETDLDFESDTLTVVGWVSETLQLGGDNF